MQQAGLVRVDAAPAVAFPAWPRTPPPTFPDVGGRHGSGRRRRLRARFLLPGRPATRSLAAAARRDAARDAALPRARRARSFGPLPRRVDISSAGTAAASFLASGVESVEALTIVLALGVTRGWRASLWGAAAAFVPPRRGRARDGPSLTQHVSREWPQLIVGVLLLTFGLQWLRKAILRSTVYRVPRRGRGLCRGDRGRAPRARRAALRTRLGNAFTIPCFKGRAAAPRGGVHPSSGSAPVPADAAPALAGAATAFVLVLVVGFAEAPPAFARAREPALKHGVGLASPSACPARRGPERRRCRRPPRRAARAATSPSP